MCLPIYKAWETSIPGVRPNSLAVALILTTLESREFSTAWPRTHSPEQARAYSGTNTLLRHRRRSKSALDPGPSMDSRESWAPFGLREFWVELRTSPILIDEVLETSGKGSDLWMPPFKWPPRTIKALQTIGPFWNWKIVHN